VITFGLALAVEGILKALLVGLTLTTAYTLVVLMTMYCPKLCRRSSASWTLSTTMAALALWLIAPGDWRVLPHPIYLAWIVSIVTFLLVAVFDKRRIQA
jgi:SSS family solute:Na+ symporter